MSYVLAWSIAFCWTLAIELPIYALVLRPVARARWTPLALALGVNLATHPAFSVWIVARAPGAAAVATAELLIAALESALVYAAFRRECAPSRALTAGVLANLTSYFAGELLLH